MQNGTVSATAGAPMQDGKLRFLRWNLHHLSLAYVVVAVLGVLLWHWPVLAFGMPAVLLVLLITDGIARPGSSLFYPTLTHGPRDGRRVALSFDDGPDPDMTPQVLDALAEAGVHATFFVIGRALA